MGFFKNIAELTHAYDDEPIEGEPLKEEPAETGAEEVYAKPIPKAHFSFGRFRRAEPAPAEPEPAPAPGAGAEGFTGTWYYGAAGNGSPFDELTPKSIQEIYEIANHVRIRPVVLNLESLKEDEVKCMLAFFKGFTYATGGRVSRIASRVISISTTGGNAGADPSADFENNGFSF